MEIIKIPELTPRDKLIYYHTILENPYIKFKPYPKQSIPIILASREKTTKPHNILAGAGGYGGKTFLGSMLAAQYLNEPDYTCLVTRRNYAELLDTNSIWENLQDWCCGEHLPEEFRCKAVKSPTPTITAPNGNTIYFKAFDREDSKCSRAFFLEPTYNVLQSVKNGLPPNSLITSTTALA